MAELEAGKRQVDSRVGTGKLGTGNWGTGGLEKWEDGTGILLRIGNQELGAGNWEYTEYVPLSGSRILKFLGMVCSIPFENK